MPFCLRKVFKYVPFEAIFWIAAIVYLACLAPLSGEHFTICPLHLLGIEWCPGCGLGRSIAHLFRGNIEHSLQSHILGIFALGILVHRIVTLIINAKKSREQQKRGEVDRENTGFNTAAGA
jgi:hypothetical protein